jgi:hypothetical protein
MYTYAHAVRVGVCVLPQCDCVMFVCVHVFCKNVGILCLCVHVICKNVNVLCLCVCMCFARMWMCHVCVYVFVLQEFEFVMLVCMCFARLWMCLSLCVCVLQDVNMLCWMWMYYACVCVRHKQTRQQTTGSSVCVCCVDRERDLERENGSMNAQCTSHTLSAVSRQWVGNPYAGQRQSIGHAWQWVGHEQTELQREYPVHSQWIGRECAVHWQWIGRE